MDLLGYLTRSRDVQRLLGKYERTEWPRVVKGVLLYGYYVLRAQKEEGLSVSELEAKVRKCGRCIQVEDQLLPTLKQQLQDVKSEIQHMNQFLAAPIPPVSALPNPATQPQTTAQPIDPPTKPFSNDEFRKGFPASKQPGKRTLMFRDTSPPALRPGLANYNVVLRPNDQWGPQWTGEDYQEDIYPKWWLDMGKMQAEAGPTGKITQDPAPVLSPEECISFRPTTRSVPAQAAVQPYAANREDEEESEEEPIETEDRAVQMPSLQASEAHPPAQIPQRHSSHRGNYSGWVGDFSDLVKRSPDLQGTSSSGSYPERLASDTGSSERIRTYNARVEAQIAQKDMEMSGGVRGSRRFEGSSGSSMSTYRPNEDMKRFYRAEYPRFAQSGGSSLGSSDPLPS